LIRYQYGNHLGSAALELDENAAVISYEEYFPYGATSYQATRNSTDTPKRYRYTGKERDEENDLSYHGARYYAPWLGRWTAVDPGGLVDGHNLYRYARNNPVGFNDSNGMQAKDKKGKGAATQGAAGAGEKTISINTMPKDPPPPPPPLPTAEEFTERIAKSIGLRETNQGGKEPKLHESYLDTVAGIPASFATWEQATMPYAITALLDHPELRSGSNPALTGEELRDANTRVLAVKTLSDSVTAASAAKMTPDDFIKNNAPAIAASGLSNDNVKTMFSAVNLRATLDKALVDANAAGAAKTPEHIKSVKASIDAIPVADRLGISATDLKTYIEVPSMWGENLAGWQRKAVNAMAGDIGSRIEAIGESNEGKGFIMAVTRSRVDAALAKLKSPTEKQIVTRVGQKNNPKMSGYGASVWTIYQRLYKPPTRNHK
jgi:RHS repeat-associated protein